MRMIRWSGLIAFIIIVGIIAVFNLLFLDGIIKGIVQDQASLAVGARVEIGDLRFKLFGLSADIQHLQVANAEQPMRNAVEVGTLSFDLAATALLKKKIVIQRMQVVDLAWDTPRRTSGALPPRLQKKLKARKRRTEVATTAEQRLEDCVLPDLSALKEFKKRSAEDLLAGVNLQSVSFLAEYRKKVSASKESWEKRLADLPTRDQIESDLKALQNLKDQRPSDMTQLPAYLEKVKTLQEKLNNTKKILADAQQEFQAEMGSLKASLKDVEKLKEQDLKTVMEKLGVKVPSAADLVCVLFGREVAQKVNWAIAWYRKLNRFMPAGKAKGEKEEPMPRPRMKGMEVRFPIIRGYPDFLLEMAEFSARPGAKSAPGKFTFDRLGGELRGLTTHPALYGKPTVFTLKGSLVGESAKEVALSGQLDHRVEPASDRFRVLIKQLRVGDSGSAAKKESPLQLTSAILDVDGSLHARGDALEGLVSIDVRSPKVAVGSTAAILADLFENMGSFNVALSIHGTLDQPSMSLSSSATKTLASGLQKLVQSKLKGIQNDIRKAISSQVDKDKTAASSETNSLEKLVQGKLSDRLGMASVKEKPGEKKKPSDLLQKKRLPFSF